MQVQPRISEGTTPLCLKVVTIILLKKENYYVQNCEWGGAVVQWSLDSAVLKWSFKLTSQEAEVWCCGYEHVGCCWNYIPSSNSTLGNFSFFSSSFTSSFSSFFSLFSSLSSSSFSSTPLLPQAWLSLLDLGFQYSPPFLPVSGHCMPGSYSHYLETLGGCSQVGSNAKFPEVHGQLLPGAGATQQL